jgi:hypothetical protein
MFIIISDWFYFFDRVTDITEKNGKFVYKDDFLTPYLINI